MSLLGLSAWCRVKPPSACTGVIRLRRTTCGRCNRRPSSSFIPCSSRLCPCLSIRFFSLAPALFLPLVVAHPPLTSAPAIGVLLVESPAISASAEHAGMCKWAMPINARCTHPSTHILKLRQVNAITSPPVSSSSCGSIFFSVYRAVRSSRWCSFLYD